jgi:ATPase subunit of ABC transporter with duplicated ATPase domains
VLLAQALFGKPDALLLDEPTNNLDLDTIRWLERFLCGYEGVLVTISHDRHFLNEVCTHIADIDYETIIVYPGGYDEMVMAKSQIRSRVEQENAERKKKIEQLKEFVAKFGAGTRASQVQSRKKQIEKLALTDLKKSNIQRPSSSCRSRSPRASRPSPSRASPRPGPPRPSARASTPSSPRARRSPSSAATASARPPSAACSSVSSSPTLAR